MGLISWGKSCSDIFNLETRSGSTWGRLVFSLLRCFFTLCHLLAVWTKCWRWWCGSVKPTWWSSREWDEPFTPTTTPCSAARASRWPSSRTRGWPTDWEGSCSAWSSSTRYRLENPAPRPWRPRELDESGTGNPESSDRSGLSGALNARALIVRGRWLDDWLQTGLTHFSRF